MTAVPVWGFGDLAVPAGVESPAARSDLFYDGAWRASAVTSWLTSPAVRAAQAAGVVSYPRGMVPDTGLRPLRGAAGVRRCGVLACARMWGSLTVAQVAAITGDPVERVVRDVRALFRAGLVDVGSALPAGMRGWRWTPETLVAAGREADVRCHLEGLAWPQWLSVTLDRPWARGSASARHNALTCELALRAGAWLDVPAVLGECLAGVDDLFGTGAGRTGAASAKRGDAVLVRRDGVRLVVETTASATPALAAKAEAWARHLAQHPGAGVVVVFVVAPPVDGADPSLAVGVRQAVLRAVRAHPGGLVDPTGPRMAVAEWQRWFPARRRVSGEFLALRAQRVGGGGSLEDVDLLEVPVAGGDQSVLSATGLMAGVPWWLRRDDLDPMRPLMARFGARIGGGSGRFGPADYPAALRTPGSLRPRPER